MAWAGVEVECSQGRKEGARRAGVQQGKERELNRGLPPYSLFACLERDLMIARPAINSRVEASVGRLKEREGERGCGGCCELKGRKGDARTRGGKAGSVVKGIESASFLSAVFGSW